MRPLTVRMQEVVSALEAIGRSATPNEIAMRAGYRDGGRRHGNGAARMGGWSGHMAPANRITFALIGLVKRGLVRRVPRADGLSGMAYELTGQPR